MSQAHKIHISHKKKNLKKPLNTLHSVCEPQRARGVPVLPQAQVQGGLVSLPVACGDALLSLKFPFVVTLLYLVTALLIDILAQIFIFNLMSVGSFCNSRHALLLEASV